MVRPAMIKARMITVARQEEVKANIAAETGRHTIAHQVGVNAVLHVNVLTPAPKPIRRPECHRQSPVALSATEKSISLALSGGRPRRVTALPRAMIVLLAMNTTT